MFDIISVLLLITYRKRDLMLPFYNAKGKEREYESVLQVFTSILLIKCYNSVIVEFRKNIYILFDMFSENIQYTVYSLLFLSL